LLVVELLVEIAGRRKVLFWSHRRALFNMDFFRPLGCAALKNV
jgi:hypothetical protein